MALEKLRDWIGHTEHRSDMVTAAPMAALAATLNYDDPYPMPDTELPPLWHWLYFTPQTRLSELGEDGHPSSCNCSPPVPLPRRMWAGTRLHFERQLRVGEEITQASTITDVAVKHSRSGRSVSVKIRNDVSDARGLAISEEQETIFCDHPVAVDPPATAQIAPATENFSKTIEPNSVLLFRYSALVLNSHRIHYDREYATQVEGYPALVVQGPLVATLLMDLIRRRTDRFRPQRFSFKVLRPLFDSHPFTICGQYHSKPKTDLWVRDHEGFLAARAQLELY